MWYLQLAAVTVAGGKEGELPREIAWRRSGAEVKH